MVMGKNALKIKLKNKQIQIFDSKFSGQSTGRMGVSKIKTAEEG